MRITKLHILILFFLAALGSFGFYFLKLQRDQMKREEEKLKNELALQKQLEQETLKKASETPPPPAPAPLPETEKKEPVAIAYTVQRGDTLWSIAKKPEHFGAGHRWYDIWKANEDAIFDFDRIVSGQVLTIPLDKPEKYPWQKTTEEKKAKLLQRGKTNLPETPPSN